MSNLIFSKASRPGIGNTIVGLSSSGHRKKSGCAGCLTNILLLVIIILLIGGGGFLYFYSTNNNEQLGWATTFLIKNKSIQEKVHLSFKNNAALSHDEKLALKETYNKFLTSYDSLSPKDQTEIQKQLGSLIKKLAKNPALLKTEPASSEIKIIFNILIPNEKIFKNAQRTTLHANRLPH